MGPLDDPMADDFFIPNPPLFVTLPPTDEAFKLGY